MGVDKSYEIFSFEVLNTALLETHVLTVSVQKLLFSFLTVLFRPKGPYIKYVGRGSESFCGGHEVF